MVTQNLYIPDGSLTKKQIKNAVFQTAKWSVAIVVTDGFFARGIPTIIIRQYARHTNNRFLMRYF